MMIYRKGSGGAAAEIAKDECGRAPQQPRCCHHRPAEILYERIESPDKARDEPRAKEGKGRAPSRPANLVGRANAAKLRFEKFIVFHQPLVVPRLTVGETRKRRVIARGGRAIEVRDVRELAIPK